MKRLVAAALLVVVAALAAPAGAGGRAARVAARAREEAARGVRYDARYVALGYPGGDVDPARGACADVVVRALRAAGVDLQVLVHEDAVRHPEAYPDITRPDASIDHRRVANVRAWLERHAAKLATGLASDVERASFRPGDVVVWRIGPSGSPRHVGIVSDRAGARGLPLVVHNLGPEAREEDVLDAWPIAGHYRVVRE